jgi:hypothetical protein
MCAVTVRMTNSTRVKDGMRHRERTLEQYGVNSPRFDSRASPHQKEKGRGTCGPRPNFFVFSRAYLPCPAPAAEPRPTSEDAAAAAALDPLPALAGVYKI